MNCFAPTRLRPLALAALLPWFAGCVQPAVAPAPVRQSAEHAVVPVSYEYDYLRYLPKGYRQDSGKRWPLLLFLHGAGERGGPLDIIKRTGLTLSARVYPLV